MRRGTIVVAALFCIALVGAGRAFAFVPGQMEDYRVPHPNQMTPGPFEKSTSMDAGVAAFSDRWGGRWWAEWNRFTGTAHHFHGTGIERTGGQTLTAEWAEATALDFVAAHPELFRASVDDLRLSEVVFGNGKCSVLFDQYHKGIPVLRGQVNLLLTETGRLYAFGSDFHPEIDLAGAVDRGPDRAIAVAAQVLGFNESSDEVLGAEPMVFPVLTEDGYEYHLCYKTTVKTEVPMGTWVSFVDAGSGEILWRYNKVKFVDVTGAMTGYVDYWSHCDEELVFPLPHAQVSVVEGNTATTDADGNFVIPHDGSDPVTVEARL
jgi:hypothetical protein